MKKKVLKSILIILVVLILVYIIFVGRKVMILSKLDKSVLNYEETNNNIYMRMGGPSTTSENTEVEIFVKDNDQKSVVTRTRNGDTIKLIQIIYPDERKMYTEAEGNKYLNIYKENENEKGKSNIIPNVANSINLGEKIKFALTTRIRTTKIGEKDCYELYSKNSPMFLYSEDAISISMYVEKDTGLPVRRIETIKKNDEETISYIQEYEIKFDYVTDEHMIEPDESEYTIK